MTHSLDWLKGSIPPLVTPFRNGHVDLEAYEALVEIHIERGSHGLLVNGTTSEPSTLTVAERNSIVERAVRTASGRIPVVAATGSQSLEETLELSAFADKAGADALLVVTPYYIRPPQRGLVTYFTEVFRRTDRPVMIYHIPGRTAVSVDVDTFARIKEACPHLVGTKHAATDLAFVTELHRAVGRDFRIFAGLEDLSLPMMAIGAIGMMNAAGNLDPRRVADLYNAVERNDLRAATALHVALSELFQAIFFETNPIPLKYMMRRLSLIPRNEHRPPMAPAGEALERRLDDVLARAGLL